MSEENASTDADTSIELHTLGHIPVLPSIPNSSGVGASNYDTDETKDDEIIINDSDDGYGTPATATPTGDNFVNNFVKFRISKYDMEAGETKYTDIDSDIDLIQNVLFNDPTLRGTSRLVDIQDLPDAAHSQLSAQSQSTHEQKQ